jgi:Phosphotransferase system mannitol/fructose-specific IIA domain (Ntr-type)
MLEALLTKNTIRLHVRAKNWEDAIRKGGALLQESGAVEQSYVEAMICAVQDLGPYMVIAPGIAMPHAKAEAGVKHLAMSLLTLESPVEFGNHDNDPVWLVLCLAAVDHTTHLQAMSEMAMLLSDAEKMNQIKAAKCREDVLSLLKV